MNSRATRRLSSMVMSMLTGRLDVESRRASAGSVDALTATGASDAPVLLHMIGRLRIDRVGRGHARTRSAARKPTPRPRSVVPYANAASSRSSRSRLTSKGDRNGEARAAVSHRR